MDRHRESDKFLTVYYVCAYLYRYEWQKIHQGDKLVSIGTCGIQLYKCSAGVVKPLGKLYR